MRIAIAGAGLGGLAAAHGLIRAGHEVTVYEKHDSIDRGLGYRMRLDPVAAGVLSRLLPPDSWAAMLASAAGDRVVQRRRFLDQQLRCLSEDKTQAQGSLFLGPGPLRRLLLRGLEHRVRYGTRVESYDVRPGSVRLELAGGEQADADLLVVAEGVHSRLRADLTGDTAGHRSGTASVAGRLPGRPADHGLTRLADALDSSVALALGPHDVTVFLTVHDPARGTIVDPRSVAGTPELEDAYTVWAVMTDERRIPADADADELAATAQRLVADWHPEMQKLVRLPSDPPLSTFSLYAGSTMPVWPTTAVTILGDAVHPIPPTGGIGGSTAIRDAGHLVDALTGVEDRSTAIAALHAYENTVRGYADEIIERSVAPLRFQQRTAAPWVHAGVTTAMRGAYAIRSLARASAA